MILSTFFRIATLFLVSIYPTLLNAQVWIDGRTGIGFNNLFEIDKSNQIGQVSSGMGNYALVGVRHWLGSNLMAFYGLEFQTFRAGSNFEQGQGRSAFGHDLDFIVDYLSVRVGMEQQFFETRKFELAGTFSMVVGSQIRNKVSGRTWKFVPEDILGPDEQVYTIFIKSTEELSGQRVSQINSYFFSAHVGLLTSYNLNSQVKLLLETFYSFTFTPFLYPGSHSLRRNGLNAGIGLSYLLFDN